MWSLQQRCERFGLLLEATWEKCQWCGGPRGREWRQNRRSNALNQVSNGASSHGTHSSGTHSRNMRFSAHMPSCCWPCHSQVVKNIAQKSNELLSGTLVCTSATAASFGPLRAIRTRFVLDCLKRAIVVNKVMTNCASGMRILHVEASFISVERGLCRGSRAEPLSNVTFILASF